MIDQSVKPLSMVAWILMLWRVMLSMVSSWPMARKCNRLQGQWLSLPVSGTGSVRAGRHRKLIVGDRRIAEPPSGGARTEAPVAPRAATAGETDKATETEYDSDLCDFMELFESSERSEA